MQFSIVDVVSFWAAARQNIAGNHHIQGQTKIFELFEGRSSKLYTQLMQLQKESTVHGFLFVTA